LGYFALFIFIFLDVIKKKIVFFRKKIIRIGLIILIIQFFIYGFILFAGYTIFKINARNELKTFLTNKELIVVVNRKELNSVYSNILIVELKSIGYKSAHHSRPINEFSVDISDSKETIELIIGQDSKNKNEYWIFMKKYNSIEIGRINTRVFEVLKKE
jgi:hypothetical protein